MVIETSRPIARVAKELGINEGTLGNWVGIYRREHAGEEPPLTVSERARLRELERETRELKMELEFMKKAAAYFAVSIRKCCEKAFRWPAWRSSSAAPVMALRVRVLPGRGWLGPGAEVFGAGLPGQEAFQRLPAERLAAVPPAFVEVGGQVGEQVQRGHPGGRGDGPDHGGVPGGVPVM